VRVEQPEALASYVLKDQPEWTGETIAAAMHGEQERVVKLKKALPVYLGYWTAATAADGTLQFLGDVYGIDARQQRLVSERLSRMKKSAEASPAAPPGASARGTESLRGTGSAPAKPKS
jgi:murein L,D-transpeptidase YcbB/YkuD